jgi:hypothetical protein
MAVSGHTIADYREANKEVDSSASCAPRLLVPRFSRSRKCTKGASRLMISDVDKLRMCREEERAGHHGPVNYLVNRSTARTRACRCR